MLLWFGRDGSAFLDPPSHAEGSFRALLHDCFDCFFQIPAVWAAFQTIVRFLCPAITVCLGRPPSLPPSLSWTDIIRFLALTPTFAIPGFLRRLLRSPRCSHQAPRQLDPADATLPRPGNIRAPGLSFGSVHPESSSNPLAVDSNSCGVVDGSRNVTPSHTHTHPPHTHPTDQPRDGRRRFRKNIAGVSRMG